MANFTGRGIPSERTVGAIGDIYTNELSGAKYKCTGSIGVHAYENNSTIYCWTIIPENAENSGSSEMEQQWITFIERDESKSVTKLPEGLTTIGPGVFQSSKNLELTSLPSGITSIGEYAFSSCSKLALTSLPEGLTTIGKSAFYSCHRLAITSIPASVTTINGLAFAGCAGLTEITFMGKPTSIDYTAFQNTGITTFNVPWAEGEVGDAPWGVPRVTINYNYTGK